MDVMQSMVVFRRVVEAGSFSVVARETDISQSSVSKHVAALEQRLGTKLLNRSTRQLNLTEAGKEYYHYCVRILNDFQEAEASVGKGRIKPTGTLRLSASAPFSKIFLVPFMHDFLEKYPEIEIELLLHDHYVDLVKEGIDVAVRIGPLEDSSLIAQKIGTSPRVLVASSEYINKHGEPQTPSELQNHNCLIYLQQKTPYEWFFNSSQHGTESTRVSGRIKANSPDAISGATRAGLGISIMCEWYARKYIEQGELKIILPDYSPVAYEIHAIYPERRFVPQKVKRLIEHLRTSFKTYE